MIFDIFDAVCAENLKTDVEIFVITNQIVSIP